MACESEDDNTGLGYGIVMLVSLCLSGPGLRKVLPLYAYCAYQRITYHTCHVLRITRINVSELSHSQSHDHCKLVVFS